MQHLVFPGRLVSSFDSPDSGLHEESSAALEEPVSVSEQLAQAITTTPPALLQVYKHLPDDPPSAGTDPEAAYSLHSLLSSLDPAVASRWHWKDTRKVLRSLQIIKQSGRLSSDIIQEQSETTLEPRYRTLFLWMYAKPEVLNPRLDLRVEEMMQRGLLKEVEQLTDIAGTQPDTMQAADPAPEMDYTLGIYQSIGYREFSQYLKTTASPKQEKMYADAVERMKISTRKYAKRQVRWIRNTLLPVVNAANAASKDKGDLPVVPTYLLDATELGDSWDQNVRSVAERITCDFLGDRALPDSLELSDTARDMLSIPDKSADPVAKLKARRRVVCSVCTVNKAQPVMIEEGREWQIHVGTRTHRRLAQKAEQRPEDADRAAARTGRNRDPSSIEGSRAEHFNMSLILTNEE